MSILEAEISLVAQAVATSIKVILVESRSTHSRVSHGAGVFPKRSSIEPPMSRSVPHRIYAYLAIVLVRRILFCNWISRKSGLPPWADNQEHRRRPAQYDRSPGLRNRNNGSSHRRLHRTPSRQPSAAPASGHRPCAAALPFCSSACRNDHAIRLSRARAKNDAETVEVIARGASLHHLNRATGKTEGHRPQ